ncbi:FeoA family protein [Halodesulfurarchaeum sp.]|uniref:FeoA family protein n=1 Tax=Halodesulfurarchaeum sp. TaxID=1980530 RepID=UPI002FC366AC
MDRTLADVSADTAFEIEVVKDNELRAKLRRLGFLDGRVNCQRRLSKGPVVVSRRGTDLALGAGVAKTITITEVEEL